MLSCETKMPRKCKRELCLCSHLTLEARVALLPVTEAKTCSTTPRQSMCQHLSSFTQQVERCEICVFTSYFPCKHLSQVGRWPNGGVPKPLYKCWEMTNAAAAQGRTAGVDPGLLTSSFIHSFTGRFTTSLK